MLRFIRTTSILLLLLAYANSSYADTPEGESTGKKLEKMAASLVKDDADDHSDDPYADGYKLKKKARRVEFGATAVFGGTSLRYSAGTVKGKRELSFGGGLYTKLNLGHFAMRTEVLYERNGAQHPDGKLRTNSVVVPFDLMFQTKANNSFGGYVSLGAFYRHTFSGRDGASSMDFSNFYRNEGGMQWGFGVWFGSFTVGANFRYGLTNLTRDRYVPLNSTLRSRTGQLKVGFRF